MVTDLKGQIESMREHGLLTELARLTGLSTKTISRIANGETQDSRISTVSKVLTAIQIVKAKRKRPA